MAVETYGFKFLVDAKDAAKGYGDFQKAVDGVFASLTRFEAHAKKTMDEVSKTSRNGKSDIAKYTQQFKALGSIPVDGKAPAKIFRLNEAMKGFRAPNTTQVANLRSFFRTMGQMPNLTEISRSVRNIGNLGAAMNGFKAPSSSQSKRLLEFSRALEVSGPGFATLRNLTGISGIANELATISMALANLRPPTKASITNLGNLALALRQFNFSNLTGASALMGTLTSISGFRAPGAAQIRNLQTFVTAIGTLKVPPNASQVASVLQRIATAATSAAGQLRGFRGNLNSIGWTGFNHGARTATINMMGLQNAFSATYQIGSILRTLFGSLTVAELGRSFFEATNRLVTFSSAMKVVNKDQQAVNSELSFATTIARNLGLDYEKVVDTYSKFAISANKAGATVAQTRNIFEGFGTAMAVMGTSTEKQTDVMLALQQVMNKGYLAGEELNQQLNEHLPGALGFLRQELKKHGKTLESELKNKSLDATQSLLFLAQKYKEEFGPSIAEALNRPAAQMSIFKTNLNKLFEGIGNNGANQAFVDLMKKINSFMTPETVDRYAKAIGETLKKAVDSVSRAFDWLRANWDSIKGPLSSTLKMLGTWAVVSGTLQIAKFITMPLFSAYGAFQSVKSIMASTTVTMRALITANKANLLGMLAYARVAPVMGTLAIATAGVKAAFTALIATLTSATSIFIAVTALISSAVSAHMSLKGAIQGVNPLIDESSKLIEDLGFRTMVGANNTATLGAEHDAAAPKIRNFAGEVGGLAQQLWDLAAAQRATRLQNIAAQRAKIEQKSQEIEANTEAGLARRGARNPVEFVSRMLARFGYAANRIATFGDSERDAQRELQRLRDKDKELASEYYSIERSPLDREVTGTMRAGLGGQYSGDMSRTGAGDDAKKKGKTAHDLLRELQSDVDDFAKRLLEDSPLDKLFVEFVQDLTKMGDTLLNDKSFKQYTQNLKADFADGKVSVEGLISALNSGGIEPKVLADLKARYKMDTNDIIRLLRTQQQAYETNVKEATVKAISAQVRSSNTILRRLGESDPGMKLIQDFVDDVAKSGEELLSADSFQRWYTQIMSGAINAEDALSSLITEIKNGGVAQSVLTDLANRAGVTVDKLIESYERMGLVFKHNQNMLKEEETFMGTHLRQLREQIGLAAMNDRQSRVASALLDEIYAKLKKKGTVNQAEIDSTMALLELEERRLDIMNQQREFFENNGIHKYIKDLQSAGEAVHNMDNNFLRNMEDTLFRLGTTGKLSFKSLIDGMQEDLIRFASQGLTKGFVDLINPSAAGQKNPSIFGGLFNMMGFDTGFEAKPELGASMTSPMFVKLVDGLPVLGGGQFSDGLPGLVESMSDPNNPNAVPNIINNGVQTGMNMAQGGIVSIFTNTFRSLGDVFQSVFGSIFGGMGGGGGGLGGLLGGLFGGGGFNPSTIAGLSGDVSQMIAANPGIFREGGIVGNAVATGSMPVSAFVNAPHYAQGTPNTSGGHPAVLHDNEAVIPLSRGRKVPVELTGGVSGANGTVIHNNFTVNTPDADSFRRSKQQIATDLHMAGARAFQRNNG